jgi:uncharacterized protein (DUF4415 family)
MRVKALQAFWVRIVPYRGPESLPPDVLAAFPKTQVNKGGRPKVERPKVPVSTRLDPDLADHLRSSGKGWQTRVNEILVREWKEGRL